MSTTKEKEVQAEPPKQKQTIKEWVASEHMRSQIAASLPGHINPNTFVRIVMTSFTKNPRLTICTVESLFRCVMELAQLGLEPDGKRAHLIPRNNNKTTPKCVECTYIVDYKGLVDLIHRSGEVSSIHSDVVYTNDFFEYQQGTEAFLKHKEWMSQVPDEAPAEGKKEVQDRGKMYAAYSCVKMKDGTVNFTVMSKKKIDAIRKRSSSSGDGPWVTDYDEMAKKSVFRNLAKWIPFSSDLRDKIDKGDDYIDVESSSMPDSNQSGKGFASPFVDLNLKSLPVPPDHPEMEKINADIEKEQLKRDQARETVPIRSNPPEEKEHVMARTPNDPDLTQQADDIPF